MDILKIAQNCGLHDYSVEDIIVDYKAGQIKFQLLTPNLSPCEFIINCFLEFSIQNKAPWGEGHYICSSHIQKIDGHICQLELELNSGDQIFISFDCICK